MSVSATTALANTSASLRKGNVAPSLSTDYLNRFNEALMLIEMASTDETVIEDLRDWTIVGYREHFLTSNLRCSAEAIAAYDGIESGRRKSFEQTCFSMARLIRTITSLLVEKPHPPDLAVIIEVASESLRKLIGRSTQFINANGTVALTTLEDRSIQADVDALLARRS